MRFTFKITMIKDSKIRLKILVPSQTALIVSKTFILRNAYYNLGTLYLSQVPQ